MYTGIRGYANDMETRETPHSLESTLSELFSIQAMLINAQALLKVHKHKHIAWLLKTECPLGLN